MPMPLEHWQERLEKHFTALAATRSESGFPLFALEHGLSNDEFEEITRLLRSRLAAGLSLGTHWLLWVVYATELGYAYDGDEYWRTFEEQTPHWRERASRSQLRHWFSKFHATYHGVKPSGPWADWFSIIAWPITHAILPKYLQLQFAKALYGLRYRLAGLDILSPAAVGRMLAANAWDVSSRFREFLQQEELAGRIVLVLLSHRTIDSQSPVYAPTLRRIVSDLERVRSAREWLKETRRVVTDRFQGTSHGSGLSPVHRETGRAGQEDGARAPPASRPALLLRRSGKTTWSVVIDIPGFGGLRTLNPELTAFLKRTRCKVAGAADTWLPAGWLLSGAQRRVLKSWPDTDGPLLTFERPDGMLEHLLDSECRLTPGPAWLCRVGVDGIAREIAGRIVRPGHKYVLLSREPFTINNNFFSPCIVDCAGIAATSLTMPDAPSVDEISELHQLGLQVARTIRIWPAGLAGRSWDGEGHSEWLTTEAPCFGIVHDHPVDDYVLCLNHGAETVIEAGVIGRPVFVRIPPLPRGSHALSVKARRIGLASAIPSLPPAEGIVALEVREPEPWVLGTTSHAGLAVSLDPPDPSLDTFWEGNVSLSVLGPEGYRVTCSVTLVGSNKAEILTEEIGTFDLPVTTANWSSKFGRFVKDEARAWKYLEASSGSFVIRGDELGQYALRLERDVKPVRWVCRNVHRTTTIRLIDDTGRDEPASVRFFAFRRPAMAASMDTAQALAGVTPETPGGLFVAQHGEHIDALVVSTSHSEAGFQGLLIEPDLHDLEGGAVEISTFLKVLAPWSDARLAGPLAGYRRNHITKRVFSCLYANLCGVDWARAETAYLSNPHSLAALKRLERAVGGWPGFAAVLSRDYEKMEAGTGPGAQWFAEVSARYDMCMQVALCEFALRLASQPRSLATTYGDEFDSLLGKIRDKAALLRGARLLALRAIVKNADAATTSAPRWIW